MNRFAHSGRAITAFVLASALYASLAGCSNKTAASANQASPVASPAGSPSGTASAAAPTASPNAPPAAAPVATPQPPTLPRGTRLEVRLNQAIDVKHAAAGDRFSGTLAQPVVDGNTVVVPAGSSATGEVLVARRRGRFKGKSVIALTLTRLDVNGTEYRIDTGNLSRSKKGKGKRSAALIGGGAGMGMLIGGLATGGVGLLVGGLAGGGAGVLGAAFTGNRDISIPAETVVTFRLQDALTLAPVTQQASLAHDQN
ncbi:MAG: hypothetical protein WA510_13760 [Acidobacteriaceae bacterium]